MNKKIIYTFDSRNYMLWDFLKEYEKINPLEMNEILDKSYNEMILQLDRNGIKYSDLKNLLIPQKHKKEICLVFDSSKIKHSMYGLEVFKIYFPTIEKIEKTCVFAGDLIANKIHQEKVKIILNESINKVNESNYMHSTQYYLIYLNNLSNSDFNNIINAVSKFKEFFGYIDTTFASPIKNLISTCIFQQYFKYKKNIVMSKIMDEDGLNNIGYPFEDYDFSCKYINETEYNSFLCYKIFRPYYSFDEDDQLFSINTITSKISKLKDFDILIEDKKFKYLQQIKLNNESKLGLDKIQKQDLIRLIKHYYNPNYIYNIEFNNHGVYKFNLILDLELKKNDFKRFILAFKYNFEEEVIELITMF